MWPFNKKDKTQRAFGAVFSILGLLLTAIGLNNPEIKIFNFGLLGVGFVLFFVGLIYLLEVIFD